MPLAIDRLLMGTCRMQAYLVRATPAVISQNSSSRLSPGAISANSPIFTTGAHADATVAMSMGFLLVMLKVEAFGHGSELSTMRGVGGLQKLAYSISLRIFLTCARSASARLTQASPQKKLQLVSARNRCHVASSSCSQTLGLVSCRSSARRRSS